MVLLQIKDRICNQFNANNDMDLCVCVRVCVFVSIYTQAVDTVILSEVGNLKIKL